MVVASHGTPCECWKLAELVVVTNNQGFSSRITVKVIRNTVKAIPKLILELTDT